VDGGTIFSGDSDGSLRFWRASDGQLMNSISAHQHAISDVSISPDGNFLATCSAAEADLKVWRVREGSLLASINTGSPIVSCAFSPDSMSVAGVVRDPEKRWSSGELRIWRVQDRAILHSLTNELQRAESISWAKNGVLAAGRLDAVALLFSLPPPEPKAPTLNPVHLIGSGSLRLGVTADAGTTLRLQSTTNFLQWLERTNVAANGTEQWFDFPLSTNSQEFFRAFSE
jgi:WD40 repeat protein